MQLSNRIYFGLCLLLVLLLGQLSTPVATKRIIFYNKGATVQRGQLLHMNKMSRPCPNGKIRDHRDRCRRALYFGRNK